MRLPSLSPIFATLGPIPALVLAAAILAPQPAVAEAPAKLSVTITGIKEAKGALMIAVYDEAGYDKDVQVSANMVPVTGATAAVSFDLPPGKYAIKMYHDVDGDGKMGVNPFGMPIEPFAFSNNAPATFGPATWDAANFTVSGPATATAIKLN
jgi:uncharacterized protein (DUF2141 family)